MMRKAVQVRTMAEQDIEAVLGIQDRCYTAIIPESGQSLRAKLDAARTTCFVAACEGRVVGYLMALPWEAANPPRLNAQSCRLPATPDCLYLHDLAVAPEARRSGAARALLDACFAKLRELGLGRVCLIAVQDSAEYWERHGFRTVAPSGLLQGRLATYGDGARYMERSGTGLERD